MGKFLRALKPRRPGIVKRIAYRLGARPHPGSLLYSPSLQWSYSMQGFGAALQSAMDAEARRAGEVIAAIYARPVHEGDLGETVSFPLYVDTTAFEIGMQRAVDFEAEREMRRARARFESSDCPHVDIEYRADGYVCRACGLGVTRDSHRDCDDLYCAYAEPHRHGFACDRSCSTCGGR